MKILFVGYILLVTIVSNAQIKTPKPTGAMTVVPVEKKTYLANSYQDGIPDDTYLKDVNHLLDKYIGTWKGETSTYKYEFRVTKFIGGYGNWQEDKLAIRYIITDLNGKVIENTTALPDDSPYVVEGRFFEGVKYNSYSLTYIGKESGCGQKGDLFISCKSDIPSPTRMKVNYFPSVEVMYSTYCPEMKWAKQIMPVDSVYLYKQ